MKTLLHIISSPRKEYSRTLRVSNELLKELALKGSDWHVDELNLFEENLPTLTKKRIDGKITLLSGKDMSADHKLAWEEILQYIQQFLNAEMYVLSVPMWNFSIPYVLKHYIDIIVQPRYLFQYTPQGPEGLVQNKKMIVVTSRGGDYSPESPFHAYDLQEKYLRTVFGYVGFKDIFFVNAQPMDQGGEEDREQKIAQAYEEVRKLATTL